MAISVKTHKTIWGQFAAQCSICREGLIHVNDANNSSLVGEVAHIVGEREQAARGKHLMALEDRDEPENLLLLCRKHHKIVDDDEALYTVDKLHSIKREYLHWKESSLAKALPWKTSVSQLCYINVPRLCEVAELQGYTVDLSRYKEDKTLHSLGWDLNHVMSAFRQVLASLSLTAIPIEFLEYAHEGYVGSVVAFERMRFRTKNIPMNAARAEDRITQIFSGDLSMDPHIYSKQRKWTLVLNIDANWITTTTAFTLFRPSGGQSTFSGLARITNVDYENDRMFGTPWLIGLPQSLFHTVLERAEDVISPLPKYTAPTANNLDALVDLEEGMRREVFFSPPPEACNLCRRLLQNEK